MQKLVHLTVVGKVFNPNKHKKLLLNQCLNQYHRLVKWYLHFDTTSKNRLHRHYKEARSRSKLNTALVQTARDKAVETLKAFRTNRKPDSTLTVNRVSIRFDRRCSRLDKTDNKMTPYWLTLSLGERVSPERVSLPIVFGTPQREKIALAEWKPTTVEMVKRGEWYAHFTLEKTVNVEDEPETVVAVDRGEVNLATAVAINKDSLKPLKGKFWRGTDIKRTRGLYGHVRRSLQKKGRGKVKALRDRERRVVEQRLHRAANEIVEYAKQFKKPVIVMEDLTGIRSRFRASRRVNRRFHTLPFRRLQAMVEYKALLREIEVRYVDARNTTKTCHRCGHVAPVRGREYRCSACDLVYNRDLNAAVNIAQRLTRALGWGSCDAPELADVTEDAKSRPNARSPRL